jgi:hypothetical protein
MEQGLTSRMTSFFSIIGNLARWAQVWARLPVKNWQTNFENVGTACCIQAS